jgi:hypothetical protein
LGGRGTLHLRARSKTERWKVLRIEGMRLAVSGKQVDHQGAFASMLMLTSAQAEAC